MPILPTAFLPHLPRTQYTLYPLSLTEITAHIAILKELYLPPVHGGLSASDALYDDDDEDEEVEEAGREGVTVSNITAASLAEKKRRFSSSLADNVDINLVGRMDDPDVKLVQQAIAELEIDIDGQGTDSSTPLADRTPMPPSSPILAAYPSSGLGQVSVINGDNVGSSSDADAAGDSDTEDEDEDNLAHLDPFERSWAQKWLEGVVRRAQTWIESVEEEEEEVEERETGRGANGVSPPREDGFTMKDVEGVLRDATAALALMAGTSGELCGYGARCVRKRFREK